MPSFFDQTTPAEASHHNGFAGNRLDRLGAARDEASLAAAAADPRARYLLFAQERALIAVNGQAGGPGRDAAFDRPAAQRLGLLSDSLVLLGEAADGPRLAGVDTLCTVGTSCNVSIEVESGLDPIASIATCTSPSSPTASASLKVK